MKCINENVYSHEREEISNS